MDVKALTCKAYKTAQIAPKKGIYRSKKLSKKIMASLVAMLVVLMSIPMTVWASCETFDYNDETQNMSWVCTIINEDNDEVSIKPTNKNSINGAVTIPSIVTNEGQDYKVTSLDYAAFSNCQNLNSINIPNTITSIGEQAFYSCTTLSSIIISCDFDKGIFTKEFTCIEPQGDEFYLKNYTSSRYAGTFTYVHDWQATTGGEYQCKKCGKIRELYDEINFYGMKWRCILQDPYMVLPEGTTLKIKVVVQGSNRYNELFAQLDKSYRIESLLFFEIELYDANGNKLTQMPLSNKVRLLMQIPNGWDKKDLEASLVMSGEDIQFEEEVVTIDGIDYLAFWTDHFSPYALIDKLNDEEAAALEKQESNIGAATKTGESNTDFYVAFSFVLISALAMIFIVFNRKKKIN